MTRKLIPIFTLLVALLVAIYQTVEACKPTPPQDLIDCRSLGADYPYGFRLSAAREGKYTLSSHDGQLTGGAPEDQDNFVRIRNSQGGSFDWASSLKIKAVIVQTSGKPKIYKYDGATAGSQLKGARDSQGQPYPILKVDFCYDYSLTVTQKTQGIVTQTVDWDITKTAAGPEQWKFIGDTAKFNYTVAVNKTTTKDIGYRLVSKVTIKNETPLPAVISSIKDILSPGNLELKLNCGKIDFPYTLPSGKTLTCTAEKSIDGKTDGEVKVIVKACSDSKVNGGGSGGKIDWKVEVSGGGSITVTDTNVAFKGPYTVTDNQNWTYSVEIACPVDPAAYNNGEWNTTLDNTAAIQESGKKASQSVKLHCYAPGVSSTASTSYSNKYAWGIKKTSPVKDLSLTVNQSQPVDYTVNVSVTGKSEVNYKLSGVVTIANPNPSAPLTISLTDEIAPGQPAVFSDCASPVTIPAGGQAACHFANPLSAKTAGTNSAQVSYNAIAFTTTVPYDFDTSQVDETDECVTVTDDKAGPLGTVCADKAPQTFTYHLTVGPYTVCNNQAFPNTASFVTNDTQAAGSDIWTVNVTIKCDENSICSLTEGDWARSADPSKADTFDATWNKVQPSGPTSPFFQTEYTWIGVLQNSPKDGYYYALARAYVAASLNKLRGVSTLAGVDTAIAHAAVLLDEYDTHMQDITGTPVANDFNSTYYLLNLYNFGLPIPQ